MIAIVHQNIKSDIATDQKNLANSMLKNAVTHVNTTKASSATIHNIAIALLVLLLIVVIHVTYPITYLCE